MGLGRLIKRAFYRAEELERWKYNLERRTWRKIIHPSKRYPKPLQKSQRLLNSGTSLPVTIWYRPLDSAVTHLFSWKTTGHWSVQVGDRYYELLVDKSQKPPTDLGIHSALPFTKDPKSISKTTYTTLSAEDVDNEVRRLFDGEFSERYSVGMEDCQNFCLRVCELICPDDEQSRNVRGYFYSKSFTRVLAATPPPRH